MLDATADLFLFPISDVDDLHPQLILPIFLGNQVESIEIKSLLFKCIGEFLRKFLTGANDPRGWVSTGAV